MLGLNSEIRNGSSIPNLGWDSFTHTVPTLASICGGLERGPQDVHVVIPRTCEYGTLHDRKDFADVIKLKILNWRDFPGLSEWAPYNHQGPESDKVT